MSKINLSQSQSNSTSTFHEQLNRLSSSTRPLMVDKKGALSNAHTLAFAWEKFKGALGLTSRANKRLVELKALQFLNQGKSWIQPQQDLPKIMLLAKRAGLAMPGGKTHQELEALIAELSTPSPKESPQKSLPAKAVKPNSIFPKAIPQVKAGLLLKAGAAVAGVLASATTGFLLSYKYSTSNQDSTNTGKQTKEESLFPSSDENSHSQGKQQKEQIPSNQQKINSENLEGDTIKNSKKIGNENNTNASSDYLQVAKEHWVTAIAFTSIIGLGAYFLVKRKPSSNKQLDKNSKDKENPNLKSSNNLNNLEVQNIIFKDDNQGDTENLNLNRNQDNRDDNTTKIDNQKLDVDPLPEDYSTTPIKTNNRDNLINRDKKKDFTNFSISENKTNSENSSGKKNVIKNLNNVFSLEETRKNDNVDNQEDEIAKSPNKRLLGLQNLEFHKTYFEGSSEEISKILGPPKSIKEIQEKETFTPQLNKIAKKTTLLSPQKNSGSISENNDSKDLIEATNLLNKEGVDLNEIEKAFQNLVKTDLKQGSDLACTLVMAACKNPSNVALQFVQSAINYWTQLSTKEGKKILKQALNMLIKVKKEEKNNPYLYEFLMACIKEKSENENCTDIIKKAINSNEDVCSDALYEVFETILKEDNIPQISYAFILASTCAEKTNIACEKINKNAFICLLNTEKPVFINYAFQLAGISSHFNHPTSLKTVNTAYAVCKGELKEYQNINFLKDHVDCVQKFFRESIQKPHTGWKTVINQAIETFNYVSKPLHITFALDYLFFLKTCKENNDNQVKEAYEKGIKILKEKNINQNFKQTRGWFLNTHGNNTDAENFIKQFFEPKIQTSENKTSYQTEDLKKMLMTNNINIINPGNTKNITEKENSEEEKKKCITF